MADAHTDIAKHVKLYIGVFIALAVFTVITVAASQWDIGHRGNVALALVIATIKGTLVASVFMHLKWERGMTLWVTFAISAIFFAVLLLVPVLAVSDAPPGVQMGTWG